MKKLICVCCLTVLCVCFASSASHAFWVWTPETNKWVNPKYSVKDTPQEQLEFALSFYESEDYAKADHELSKLIKYYPKSREAAEAQYYLGRIRENREQLFEAVKVYQRVIDQYPFSERASEIVKKQYEIGERMLEGEGQRSRIMDVIIGNEYPVVEVFKMVIKNAPYSEYAAPAQYKIGLYLQGQGLHQEARDAFEKVVNDYPDSDWVKAAKYQIALADAQRSNAAPYDQRTTTAAVEEFREFVKQYPDAELSDKAKSQISELRSKEAENNFLIARYYEKTGSTGAARIYYNTVIDEYGDTSWAVKALERIRELELEKQ